MSQYSRIIIGTLLGLSIIGLLHTLLTDPFGLILRIIFTLGIIALLWVLFTYVIAPRLGQAHVRYYTNGNNAYTRPTPSKPSFMKQRKSHRINRMDRIKKRSKKRRFKVIDGQKSSSSERNQHH